MVLLVKVHADACVALAIDAAVRVLVLDVEALSVAVLLVAVA